MQRGHSFAIVDEVDSILIDEARTPLIISGPATVSTHQYDQFKPLVDQLYKKQTLLCNRLMSEADENFKAGKLDEGGRQLFKVKLGQPRNKRSAAHDGRPGAPPRAGQSRSCPFTPTRKSRSCSRSRRSYSSPSTSAPRRPISRSKAASS